jgi:MoxR-like ATPase
VPPKFLPTAGKGILFLDELTSAPQMTQAGCYQLVLDRKLGEYVLPDGWVVIAAGNPASERGVHFSMPRPLRNRFVHLELEADLNDWCKWAVGAGVRPEIIAFLRFKPDLLHTADATSDANAWPTPRSWEMASNVLRGIANRQKTTFLSGASEFEAQLLDGTVGPAAAAELIAFLAALPAVAVDRRDSAQPGDGTASGGDLGADRNRHGAGRAMTDNSVARGLKYLDRMPTEMRVMAMRDAAARDTAITHTPEFVRFGVQQEAFDDY